MQTFEQGDACWPRSVGAGSYAAKLSRENIVNHRVLLMLLGLGASYVAHAGEFVFDGWDGPPILVRLATPAASDACTPIVFVMHGASRDAPRYYEDWAPLAEEHGFIAVVPEFPADDFAGASAYNLGNMFASESGERRPEDQWSFSAIEPLFDAVVTRVDGVQASYGMYGHSAGSQFTHRYRYFKPGARLSVAVAANAGWYTMPLESLDYPYGLRGSGVGQPALGTALQRELVILLGEADNAADAPKLRKAPEAELQGPHRFARGESYYRVGKAVAGELGVPFGWRLSTVPGAGHSNALMAPAAAQILSAAFSRTGCVAPAATSRD